MTCTDPCMRTRSWLAFLFTRLSSDSLYTPTPPPPPPHCPVVLWHGMGDSCCDPRSLGKIRQAIERTLPGTYVHSVQIGAGGAQQDRRASFFGNMNDQVRALVIHPFICLICLPYLSSGYLLSICLSIC